MTQPAVNAKRVHRTTAARITNNWRGDRFSGQNYAAFRNYHREVRNRDWYRRNNTRIVFYSGAPYYWNEGYWYPAWGYNPGYVYQYDGPIYGYNGLPPDQVLVTVQRRLQAEGYYEGGIDGSMGPLTRQALADYQADHRLAVTAAVDQPTLATLGLS
ncbi:MAG: peptidoglycan-binding protein [Verrucomicrobiota bacterium]|nr:peptidoglycan-binding protein [Verrucomicrobiota bacterium]